MQTYAFISQHTPTPEQHELAAEKGISLLCVGDADAFTVTPTSVYLAIEATGFDGVVHGVVVVHPAAAMRLYKSFSVGVFENSKRVAEGEKPQFFAKALHIY